MDTPARWLGVEMPRKAALDQLASYHWPGNVRELQNTVERALILWQGGPLAFDLPAAQTNENTNFPWRPCGRGSA